MSSRLLLFATLLVVATAAAAAAQTLPCVGGQAVDPCVIDSPTSSIATGVYDIRPRSLTVANRQISITGDGTFEVLANNIVLQPGARFIAAGATDNTTISFDAAGTFDMQSQGNTKSRIDVSGNFGGGDIRLTSVGNLTVNGPLIANAANLAGYGGAITLLATAGNITITGDPSEGIRSFGNAQGGGGTIAVTATLGSISVATQLAPKNGDCSGCDVSLFAGGSITSTAQGVVDMRASGIGDGGSFAAEAGGNVNLAGDILANGSSDEFEGGAGGEVTVDAGGSATVSGRIELNAAGQAANPSSETGSVDGDGGSVDIGASGPIQISSTMLALTKGFGIPGEIAVDGFANVTLTGQMDISGDEFAGDISIRSDLLITVSGRLRTVSPIDLVNHPDAQGGAIDLDACQVNVTAAGELIATGPGGDPSGATFLVASTGLTIAGKVTATAVNDVTWRTSAPIIIGMVTPPPVIHQNSSLPCCGVQCTTTTTSTTTTSTSTLVVPTTSTTSSTSLLPATTTTSTLGTPSTTLGPTTSTTLGSTTSTVPNTTSTSSTTLATTTTTTSSTSTLAPSTSSTSVTTSSTSTTAPPLTCLDTALGIDAVRCRLNLMSTLAGEATETELGGKKLAKALKKRIAKALTLTADPTSTKRLKKAAKQLKQLSAKLGKGLANGKVDATIGSELQTFSSEAQAELAGLVTS